MSRSIPSIEARIHQIQHELASLGDFRVGTLSQQFNVCGKPHCKCKADPPERHGPYYRLSFTRKGKGHTRSVRIADVETVKQQVNNYTRFKDLVQEWVDLASELSNLRLKHD